VNGLLAAPGGGAPAAAVNQVRYSFTPRPQKVDAPDDDLRAVTDGLTAAQFQAIIAGLEETDFPAYSAMDE